MTKKLSAWETWRRREAVDFADASLRLEGFEPSPEASRRAEQFVAGDIEAHQLVPGDVRKDVSPPPDPQQQDDGAGAGADREAGPKRAGTLSALETMRRRQAVAAGDASMRLEGFEPSERSKRRAEQFIAGEIGVHELGGAAPAWPMRASLGDEAATGGGTSSPTAGHVPGRDLEQERAERQKMVDRANASSALEGYTPDAHLAELQRRFVALEIGTAEMLESCREFALKMGAQQGDAQ